MSWRLPSEATEVRLMQILVRNLCAFLLLCGCANDKEPEGQKSDGDAAAGAMDGGHAERQFVTITFKAKVGKDDFDCERSYRGIGLAATEIVPTDLRVFVQDVALLRAGDGKEVPVALEEREGMQRSEVTLLDFETNSGSCIGAGGSAETNTTVTGWVPADDYVGVAFANGVPESVNHKNPIDLTAPLVAGPLHWNWNGGFLFINAQVREVDPPADLFDASVDDGGDAGALTPGSAVVHIGSGLCSPNMGCRKSNRNRVVLSRFDHEHDAIILDVAKIFAAIDLSTTTTCHAIGVGCEAFFPALGIDYESGEPSAEQSIYRVE
jgi:uncharacterized repeat protein (TIGR04052 family)